jgi:hypothetical protein
MQLAASQFSVALPADRTPVDTGVVTVDNARGFSSGVEQDLVEGD